MDASCKKYKFQSNLLPLRILLPIVVFAIFLVIITIALYMGVSRHSKSLEEKSRHLVLHEVAGLAHLAEKVIIIEPQLLEDVVTQTAINSSFLHVAVIDPSGKILFANNFSWRGEQADTVLDEFNVDVFNKSVNTRKALIDNTQGQHKFVAMMSYTHPENASVLRTHARGVVFINYDYSEMLYQEQKLAVYDRLIEMILVLMLAVVIAEFLRRYVSRPLELISEATRNVANGNLYSKVEPAGALETRQLAVNFNKMTEILYKNITERDSQSQTIRGILNNTFDGVIAIDQRGLVISFNYAAEKIFGMNSDEVIGKNIKTLMPETYSKHHDQFISNYATTSKPKIIGIGREVEGLRKNGDVFPMDLAVTEVFSDHGRAFIGIVRDITDRKQKENELIQAQEKLANANEKLERMARTDPLTNVTNRRGFDEVIQFEFNRSLRQGFELTLMMVDIDYFKKYNDQYGHIEGDKCLISVAQTMKEHFKRSGEVVARYGGEEFAIVLPNVNAEQAIKTAVRLLQKIKNMKLEHADSPVSPYVSISIGIASIVPKTNEITLKDLMLFADQALYQAKEEGRGRAVLYSKGTAQSENVHAMVGKLRR
ncbi:MAG: diguanylate cyclase [Gammaproteobacteria bacterium]|nr:diguanylate cyclase [Gammaproteobacteria bacterium]